MSTSEPKWNDGEDPLFSLKEHTIPEEYEKDQPMDDALDNFNSHR